PPIVLGMLYRTVLGLGRCGRGACRRGSASGGAARRRSSCTGAALVSRRYSTSMSVVTASSSA
ncbi:hypothetical protein, partial [Methyloceanibacter superfactus]|uniref:hypothetical protein n=1 Tax=Methyloceanibacter superfactus TaxID=1774969 RepID=UPI00195BC222